MDFIYAIILATTLAALGIVVVAFCNSESRKPSLGVAYHAIGGSVIYWATTLASVVAHAAFYWWAPLWLTTVTVTLALAGLGFTVWWTAEMRKEQRKVAAIFAEANEEAARKAQLEKIAEKRALLAQAKSALDKGMAERAARLANDAR